MIRRVSFSLAAISLASGCSDVCNNTVISRSMSPDGAKEAVLFQRDCGATTGYSTQISVLDAGSDLVSSGNTFVADDGNSSARLGEWDAPWAEVRWLNQKNLEVTYAAGSRVFEQESEVDGVRVSFRTVK